MKNGKITKKIYFIGIGGIGVSALARYYLSEGYDVYGSDSTDSELIHSLQREGCDIIIGSNPQRITQDFKKIIYSEAVPHEQAEREEARKLGIQTLKYNEALAEVVNNYKLIAVTGTHGKSTTSSMISQILKNSHENFTSIVGTLLKEFDDKNFFTREEKEYFVIEACEHKEHFLAYRPIVGVITNIEYDHADYYTTPDDYIHAFEEFVKNIHSGGFCILNGDDKNCRKMIQVRNDIHHILVYSDSYTTIFPLPSLNSFPKGEMKLHSESNREYFPEIVLHIPGEHILFDAKLAYIVSHLIGVSEISALETLESYSGVWRRMEQIGFTENNNLLMSDYGHHPTEIRATLSALKSSNPEKKIYTIFQPHQYSRTIELLEEFKTSFSDTDILVIPDIYESRDSQENKENISTQKFVDAIGHSNVIHGDGMENTLELINQYDIEHPNSSIILLLGAGNIDNLRYKIKTR